MNTPTQSTPCQGIVADDAVRRQINRWYGRPGLASNRQVKTWYESNGRSMDDELLALDALGEER